MPGEPVTITFELEATTGSSSPVTGSAWPSPGSDWPNSWPPPEPVTLTVDAGSIRLALPTLHNASERDGGEPTPQFTPAPPDADEHEIGRRPPTVWRIEHDVLAARRAR